MSSNKASSAPVLIVGLGVVGTLGYLLYPMVRAASDAENAFEEANSSIERLASQEARVSGSLPAPGQHHPRPEVETAAQSDGAQPAPLPSAAELRREETTKPELTVVGMAKEFAQQVVDVAKRGSSSAIEGKKGDELRALMATIQESNTRSKKILGLLSAEAEGDAVLGLFNVHGEIKHRDAGQVSLWGVAVPINNDARQLGSQMKEGNLVVLNPDLDGIAAGIQYNGVHAYLRAAHGTNAFGANVPVSVYGDVPPETQQRRADLDNARKVIRDASGKLFWSYARVRRSILAKQAPAMADAGAQDDPESVSEFLDAVGSASIDASAYFDSDRRGSRGGLSYHDLRETPSQRHLHSDGRTFEIGFADTGVILGFVGYELSWVTRIHDRETLMGYMPEATQKLSTSRVVPTPRGAEGLLRVVANKDSAQACASLASFTVKSRVSTQCPELVQVRLTPKSTAKQRREIVLLCFYDGTTTRILTSAVAEEHGVVGAALFFNLDQVTANPLGFGW